MSEGADGPRYGPREAFVLRPSGEVAAEDPFARTALDPPRFVGAMPASSPMSKTVANEASRAVATRETPFRGVAGWVALTLSVLLGVLSGVLVGVWLALRGS